MTALAESVLFTCTPSAKAGPHFAYPASTPIRNGEILFAKCTCGRRIARTPDAKWDHKDWQWDTFFAPKPAPESPHFTALDNAARKPGDVMRLAWTQSRNAGAPRYSVTLPDDSTWTVDTVAEAKEICEVFEMPYTPTWHGTHSHTRHDTTIQTTTTKTTKPAAARTPNASHCTQCDDPIHAKNLCKVHYRLARKGA
jgi:hypothetical protein